MIDADASSVARRLQQRAPHGTLVELLRRRALETPQELAFTFLADGETESSRLSWRDLDAAARALGACLQARGAAGERALLLYPAGLEFVTAFLGCLYAGVLPMPAPPPEEGRLARTLPRLQAIVRDTSPRFAMTTPGIFDAVRGWPGWGGELRRMLWIHPASLHASWAERWTGAESGPEDVAYLQYSSGSTALPKGVRVTHGNLMAHLEHLGEALQYADGSSYVAWMPNHHDYGLVEGILHPIHRGIRCFVMPPEAFVKKPVRWLAAISRYRASHSSGPNFAYELCWRRIGAEEKEALDLSCWQVAGNGAEPVRRATLERFSEAFAPCGFRWSAWYPCYGLAEATLIVSGGGTGSGPASVWLRRSSLEAGRVEECDEPGQAALPVVGCGRPLRGTRVAIVDPESATPCAEDGIGEIWVAGSGVAHGYWGRPEESAGTFGARLAGSGDGPYLRTGDLGFLRDGEVFVSGRLKDLIIIHGTNHYPQDIEWTVEESHGALRHGCSAAFSIEEEGEEHLVVVAEVARGYGSPGWAPLDRDAVLRAVRCALAERHDLHLHELVLIRTGTIPKTSSGKVQRQACRSRLLDGSLERFEEAR